MPAARQRSQQTLSSSLAAHVRRQTPVNVLPLSYYYRSGHFLLRQVKHLSGYDEMIHRPTTKRVVMLQADEYRAAENEEQLFVILMRLCRQAYSLGIIFFGNILGSLLIWSVSVV